MCPGILGAVCFPISDNLTNYIGYLYCRYYRLLAKPTLVSDFTGNPVPWRRLRYNPYQPIRSGGRCYWRFSIDCAVSLRIRPCCFSIYSRPKSRYLLLAIVQSLGACAYIIADLSCLLRSFIAFVLARNYIWFEEGSFFSYIIGRRVKKIDKNLSYSRQHQTRQRLST